MFAGKGESPDQLPLLDAGPVRLRGFLPGDLRMVEEASADPLIPLVSTLPGRGSAEGSADYLHRQRHRLRDGYGYSFAIARPAAGRGALDRAVGSIGLWLRDIDEGRADIGYWIVPSARGHHYAAHALDAVSTWAFSALAIPRLQLHIEPWNIASLRTAEAAGYTCEGLLRSWQEVGEQRRDMYVYSLLPGDRPS